MDAELGGLTLIRKGNALADLLLVSFKLIEQELAPLQGGKLAELVIRIPTLVDVGLVGGVEIILAIPDRIRLEGTISVQVGLGIATAIATSYAATADTVATTTATLPPQPEVAFKKISRFGRYHVGQQLGPFLCCFEPLVLRQC